jgi:hypothetical protein
MVWGNEPRPLEELAVESAAKLWKIEIRGELAELSHALRMVGFGETMVFPELPSLATELTRTEGWKT